MFLIWMQNEYLAIAVYYGDKIYKTTMEKDCVNHYGFHNPFFGCFGIAHQFLLVARIGRKTESHHFKNN